MTATAAPTWTLESATAWRDAAVADGWSIRPTYPPHGTAEGEPVERAATLEREGWTAMVYTRPAGHPLPRPEASVSVWGPDTLAVAVPPVYSWAELQAGLTRCSRCGTEGPTLRLSFAMRVCESCRARLAPTVERGNWTE